MIGGDTLNYLTRPPKPRPDFLPGDIVAGWRIRHLRWAFGAWHYLVTPL